MVAWQEPTQTPPAGNIPTPLNVGSEAQTKEGNLTISSTIYGDDILLGNTGGVITAGGDLELYDSAGTKKIALDGDTGDLSIVGDADVGSVIIKGNSTISPNLNSDKLDDHHAADLMAQAGGGGVLVTWGQGTYVGGSAPSCPSGWTQVYAGYGPYWSLSSESGGPTGPTAVSQTCGTSQYLVTGGYYMAYACGSGGMCNTCRVCVK